MRPGEARVERRRLRNFTDMAGQGLFGAAGAFRRALLRAVVVPVDAVRRFSSGGPQTGTRLTA
jgi:hypothetical protein